MSCRDPFRRSTLQQVDIYLYVELSRAKGNIYMLVATHLRDEREQRYFQMTYTNSCVSCMMSRITS